MVNRSTTSTTNRNNQKKSGSTSSSMNNKNEENEEYESNEYTRKYKNGSVVNRVGKRHCLNAAHRYGYRKSTLFFH
jgi:hypothetical protein